MFRESFYYNLLQGDSFYSNRSRSASGSVVQCSARGLKVASSILAHGSFLVRGVALSI